MGKPLPVLQDFFPHDTIRPGQARALEMLEHNDRKMLLEIPTGGGKTPVGMCVLNADSAAGNGPLFYITPTKQQAEQVVKNYANGNVVSIVGRADYPCLYAEDHGKAMDAEKVPCHSICAAGKCGHQVSQGDGTVKEDGARPCPYYQAKYEALVKAREGGIVVTTTAFFLINRMFVSGWRDMEPGRVVIDEVHKLASIARRTFEHAVTDHHLFRVADLIEPFAPDDAEAVRRVAKRVYSIAAKRPTEHPTLLEEKEIEGLLHIFDGFDYGKLEQHVREAVRSGAIDPMRDCEELKALETVTRSIPRFIRSLAFATASNTEKKRALNYVLVTYHQEKEEGEGADGRKAKTTLTVKSYFVAPLIKKACGQNVVGYSATICSQRGDSNPRVIKSETGLDLPFAGIPSAFPPENTRIFMPKDTPDLAYSRASRDDPRKALKMMAEAVKALADKGLRSLVVVVKEDERQKMLVRLNEMGLTVITYGTHGTGVKAKEAARRFANGDGQVLLGTAGQYAEGIDLPRGLAPVIHFLRPGYQRKDDPEAEFEKRTLSESQLWALKTWRVMVEALQVRGRNIRQHDDKGVCIFYSQQFRKFLRGSLPEWLDNDTVYRGQDTLKQAVEETVKLMT